MGQANCHFCLHTALLGMNVTDTWKLKKRGADLTVNSFADQLVANIIAQAKEEEQESHPSSPGIPPAVSTSFEEVTEVSSISPTDCHQGTHTKVVLKKQVRCIWCGRVNLIERKTTVMCEECNGGFCGDESGNGCWSHHVCIGGVPPKPRKGTQKRKVRDISDGSIDDV